MSEAAGKQLEARRTEGVRTPKQRDPKNLSPAGDGPAAGKAPEGDRPFAGKSGDGAAGDSGDHYRDAWEAENDRSQPSWLFAGKPDTPAPKSAESAPPAAEEQTSEDVSPEPQPKAEGEEAATDDDADRERYEEAVLGLRFAGESMEDIAEMDREKVLRRGLALRENQKRMDAILREKAGTDPAPSDTSAEESGSEKPQLQPPPLIGEALKVVSGEIESLGGDPKALEGLETAIVSTIESMVSSQLAGLKQPQQQESGLRDRELERLVLRNARADLTETFEGLADSQNWKAVQAKLQSLSEAGALDGFDSVHAMVEHAAFLTLGESSLKAIRDAKKTRATRRRPPTPIDSNNGAKAFTMSSWETAMASAHAKGDTKEAARLKGLKPKFGVGRR